MDCRVKGICTLKRPLRHPRVLQAHEDHDLAVLDAILSSWLGRPFRSERLGGCTLISVFREKFGKPEKVAKRRFVVGCTLVSSCIAVLTILRREVRIVSPAWRRVGLMLIRGETVGARAGSLIPESQKSTFAVPPRVAEHERVRHRLP